MTGRAASDDELSREVAGMTLADEIRWLRETKLGDPKLERLAAKAREREAPAADGRRR